MFKCANCPYKDFKQYYEYYGVFDYAHQWVTAAFDGTRTNFANGNADFNSYTLVGREEAAQKGTAYMNIFMYVIRELEDALDDCKIGCMQCNDDPVHAWDEGVAFYTGSLEGQTGEGSGNLLYALADKRCENYGTCGTRGDESQGTSKANYDIFKEFAAGQFNLNVGNCEGARVNKEKIAELMAIPLIQGTLRYAYKVDRLAGQEKEKAEGAVFAAAVLPKLHACNEADATTVFENMGVGAGSTDFAKVKKAFEANYKCLGVTCADVGGLLNGNEYYEDATPCKDSSNTSSSNTLAIALGSVAGAVAILAIGSILYMRSREKQGAPVFAPAKESAAL